MNIIQIQNLIEGLVRKTKSKEIIWTKSVREDEFRVVLQTGAIIVGNTSSGVYNLKVYNNNGVIMFNEIFNSTFDQNYSRIKELYLLIRNIYYRVDETIDDILNEINPPVKRDTNDDSDLPF